MTDAAYCLRQDKRERKSLARMSRYKKNGSKSKYVRLPQTYMTEKEWKKMNGKVYTLTLSKPMSKDEFDALDDSLKREYITNLCEKYNARQIDIRNMLGYSPSSFCVECARLFGKHSEVFKKSRTHRAPSEEWLAFIGKAEAPAQADTATDFVESAPVDTPELELLEKKDKAPARKPLSLESFRIRYVGSVTDAFNKVFDMVGNEQDFVINIELYPPVPTADMLPF